MEQRLPAENTTIQNVPYGVSQRCIPYWADFLNRTLSTHNLSTLSDMLEAEGLLSRPF